ncbi:hypothetical protein [Chamaesiphon minutus]|uniref:Uncharacterized protein n=1 Tax=Chamaesiphon minutus (strain ATCC 27169 / PCC 6605) TaxID=1173020 RepID=K9UBN2_CHAP6|nr:hypothetical protein [Chamaesiphon minutus]AFY92043.1 hypothetical protein Cha6605_0775 [Chamaesiphon minutus PCC 6605]
MHLAWKIELQSLPLLADLPHRVTAEYSLIVYYLSIDIPAIDTFILD